MTDFPLVPAKIALVNVDIQNCFVENSPVAAPGGVEVLGRINRLIAVCRANGVQIVHTAHVVRPDGSNVGVVGERLPPVKEGVINKGAPSAALHDGRGANRPWLQELPDPVSKITWGTWVEMHPETAAEHAA